ncbi:hypothetical protein [Pseudomonas sp. 02C 26]|uniref:hypothetical protein n=1 Tax=Pseudomonas sp. 02C 26 TaxID=2054914 RepID=UPI0012FF33D4|nr:hypothetical protein [Pseudomonas sp. 02C 26]
MRKDWVVSIGCISLFAAGAIWGATLRGVGFFKVNNIHEFAETLAGFATVLGVVLAITEYSSWKARALAQADHELSKKALAIIRAYEPQALDIFLMAKTLAKNMYSQVRFRNQPVEHVERVRENLNMFKKYHSDICALALECRDSWGGDVWDSFEEIFSFTNQCKMVVELYLRWSNEELKDAVRDNIAEKGVATFDVISIFIGEGKEAVESHLRDRLEILMSKIKAKQLTI